MNATLRFAIRAVRWLGWSQKFKPGTRWPAADGGSIEICSELWISQKLNLVVVIRRNGGRKHIANFINTIHPDCLCTA